MFKKSNLLLILASVMIISFCQADPNLVGQWEFDTGSGTTAYDSSGNSYDGTIVDASWVDSLPELDDALDFEGPDYISIPNDVLATLDDQITIAFWQFGDPTMQPAAGYILQAIDVNGEDIFSVRGRTTGGFSFSAGRDANGLDTISNTPSLYGYEARWNHWAFVKDATSGYMKIYFNGSSVYTKAYGIDATRTMDTAVTITIGADADAMSSYDGMIDDVRIYDAAMDSTTIYNIYAAGINYARNPSPADGQGDGQTDLTLSWTAGTYADDANGHDVYIGTSSSAVATATTASAQYMGRQTATTFDITDYNAAGLDENTWYYWRVDQVEDANLYTGSVWTFGTVASWSNSNIEIKLGADGRWNSILYKTPDPDVELCKANVDYRMGSITIDSNLIPASSLTVTATGFDLGFSDDGVTSTISYDVNTNQDSNWIYFEVTNITGSRPDGESTVTLCKAPVDLPSYGSMLCSVLSDDYFTCLMPTNMQTYCRSSSRILSATTQDSPGPTIEDANFVLVVSDYNSAKDILQDVSYYFDPILINEADGVPVKDVWGRKSYWFFTRMSEDDANEAIQYCNNAGIDQMIISFSIWSSQAGHYDWNLSYWPDGKQSMIRFVDAMNANDINVGLHTFVSKVDKTDDYVSGTPDKRFYVDYDPVQLAADINSSVTSITVTGTDTLSQWPGSPVASKTVWEGGVDKHREVIIEDEIIKYISIGPGEGVYNTFQDCTRGSWSTTAASHLTDANGVHWKVDGCINGYVIDQETTLIDEVTERMAGILDDCNVNMVYFDGGEDVPDDRYNYYVSLSPYLTLTQVNNMPIIHTGTSPVNRLWHSFAHGGTVDTYKATIGGKIISGATVEDWPTVKDHINVSVNKVASYANSFMPIEFGWFGIWPEDEDYFGYHVDGLQLDQAEYLMTKCLAFDSPVSLETSFSSMEAHPLTPAILKIVKLYEELRAAQSLDTNTIEALQVKDQDYAFIQIDDSNEFVNVEKIPMVRNTNEIRSFIGQLADGSAVATIWHYNGTATSIGIADTVGDFNAFDFEGNQLTLDISDDQISIPVDANRTTLVFYDCTTEVAENYIATGYGRIISPVAKAEPVAHWKFDETTGSTAYDSQGNADATVDGADWSEFARSGGSLDFDGNDVVTHQFLLRHSAGTISHWLRADAANPMVAFYQADGSDPNYNGFGGTSNLEMHSGTSSAGTQWYFCYEDGDKKEVSGGKVEAAVWTHVAITWEQGGDLILYIDGVEEDRTSLAGAGFNGDIASVCNIGAPGDSTASTKWVGMIDDVRVFHRALPAEKILALSRPDASCRWSFSDDGDNTGTAGSAGDLTISGAYTQAFDGLGDIAIFDGTDDYMTINTDLPRDEFTICHWLKPDVIKTMVAYYEGDGNTPNHNGFSGPDIYEFHTSIYNNTWYVMYQDGADQSKTVYGGTPAVGIWTHVAASFDIDGNIKLYIDGKLIANRDVSTIDFDLRQATTRYLGCTGNQQAGRFWDGQMDDVRVYNCCLTADEIVNVMKASSLHASDCSPADETDKCALTTTLSWAGGDIYTSHNLYIGTTYAEVAEADTNSSAYVGNYAVDSVEISDLTEATDYYWCVDEVNDGSVVKGYVWSFSTTPEPNLVGYWSFDDGSGYNAYDETKNGWNGTVAGASWVNDSQRGMCLDFDGTDDYVSHDMNLPRDEGTISHWLKPDTIKRMVAYYESGGTTSAHNGFTGTDILEIHTALDDFSGNYWNTNYQDGTGQSVTKQGSAGVVGEWMHVAMTWDVDGYMRLYVDGIEVDTGVNMTTETFEGRNATNHYIGRTGYGIDGRNWDGRIDEVRVYNRQLTAAEIALLAEATAKSPNPADEAEDVSVETLLSWTSGDHAVSHDVYLAKTESEISSATTTSDCYLGNTTLNYFYPEILEASQTYYWAVDEINDTDFWAGSIWTFSTAAPDDLIGWWRFNETSGSIAYDTMLLNDANVYGAAWTSSGKIDGAIDCNGGTDYAYLDSDFKEPKEAYTVSIWFNPDIDINSTDSRTDLMAFSGGRDRPYLCFNKAATGKLYWCDRTYDDDDDYLRAPDILCTTTSWTAGTWYHYAVTFDGSSIKIYIDGVLETTYACPETCYTGQPSAVSIGRKLNDSAFDGQIDDLKVYGVALTAGQITELAQKGATHPKPYNDESDIAIDTDIVWTGSGNADSYNVYFSNVSSDVVSADTASDCCLGSRDVNTCKVDMINGTTYYWRVDEVVGSDTYAGSLWSFTTVSDADLQNWYRFDEGADTTAYDSAGSDNAIVSGATWTTSGMFNACLDFNGTSDNVYTVDCTEPRNAYTLMMWFKPDTNITSATGRQDIAAWSNGTDRPYLSFNKSATGLIYYSTRVYDDDTEAITLPSLTTTTSSWTADTWYHMAITYDGDNFKIYINGAYENSASATNTHTGQAHGLAIGAKLNGDAFDGKIDDVRLYTTALTTAEIAAQAQRGASDPQPYNGELDVAVTATLDWTPSYDANSFDVYFGENETEVTSATTVSDCYIGNQEANSYDPDITKGTRYYWRIDEVDGGNTYTGDVWTFKAVIDPNILNWWRFDEGSDSTAYDNAASADGTISGASWSTNGKIGNCLDFDGVDDVVTASSVTQPTEQYTIAMWFNPDGDINSVSTRQDLMQFGNDRPYMCFNKSGTGKIHYCTRVYDVNETATLPEVTTTTTTWSASNWYHIAVTYDGDCFKIYINGSYENVVNCADTHCANTSSIDIGMKSGYGKFDGRIDDVRIYDYAMTATDVNDVYDLNR
jgi:hypothetical protein